jgi:hypothetical protein
VLTSDLVRLKVRSGVVQPGWVDRSSNRLLEIAQRLIELFHQHEGRSRGELDEALKLETGTSRDFRFRRGLAKLLLDRTDIAVASPLPPKEMRETVFEMAAAQHPLSQTSRALILEQAAALYETTTQVIEDTLYADLAVNERVGACKAITSEGLLDRYNVALAQAVVLRSRSLKLHLRHPSPKRLRQLLRMMKFYRLLYAAEKTEQGYVLRIDGPTSILTHSTRYGLALANFLPALLLCEEWELTAEYQAKKRARKGTFHLDSSQGLVSHYRDTGTWVAPEEVALHARLKELATPWEVLAGGTVVSLAGEDTLVPDFVLRDPDTGAEALLEIVWRWRASSLKKRWRALRKAGLKHLVLAVSTSANSDKMPKLSGPVHVFKATPNARSLIKLAKEAARKPKRR